MTPAERKTRAQLGAHTRWAHTDNRTVATAPLRDGFTRKLEQQVDPEGKLSVPERAKRVESARKAHYKRMALASAAARRKNRGGAA